MDAVSQTKTIISIYELTFNFQTYVCIASGFGPVTLIVLDQISQLLNAPSQFGSLVLSLFSSIICKFASVFRMGQSSIQLDSQPISGEG